MSESSLPLGIGSWTFAWAVGRPKGPAPRNPLTPLALLAKARELGADLVQFADNLPLHERSEKDLERIRETARKAGLGIEIGTRGVAPEQLLRYLEIAEFLGSRLVRTLVGGIGEIPPPDLKRAAASIRRVLPRYAAAGVSLAIENYEAYPVRDLGRLVREIEDPHLGICLDTVNSLGSLETPERVVAELAPFVLNLHIKDFDIVRIPEGTGFSIVGRPAGSGRLDVPWLLQTLSEAGRRPSVVLELWVPFTDTLEHTLELEQQWAESSIRYLRSLRGLDRRQGTTSA